MQIFDVSGYEKKKTLVLHHHGGPPPNYLHLATLKLFCPIDFLQYKSDVIMSHGVNEEMLQGLNLLQLANLSCSITPIFIRFLSPPPFTSQFVLAR